jgi:hypothetical protein
VQQARPQRQVQVSVHLVMTFLRGMKSINVCLNSCKHVSYRAKTKTTYVQ